MLKEGDYIYLFHEKASYLVPYKKASTISTHKGALRLEEGMD
jgi:hypothetical protein